MYFSVDFSRYEIVESNSLDMCEHGSDMGLDFEIIF